MALSVLVILGTAGAASGVVIGFECITLTDPGSATIGERQLWVDVTSPQAGQASFTFHNTGTDSSTIAQIYFEQGPLAGLLSIVNSTGVLFREGGNPKSLPGGHAATPAFATTFRASADKPSTENGVNCGLPPNEEWVTLVFGLQEGRSFPDVLHGLSGAEFRVGLRVQGFASGGGESFVSSPYMLPMPEPATVGLGAAALLGTGVIRAPRRRLVFAER
jgi:hypothetical protein